MKINKKFLNSLGLIMLIIFGGNFVVDYFRHDTFNMTELIGGIVGLVLLAIGGVVKKDASTNR